MWNYIIIAAVVFIAALPFLISYICFRMTFYSKKRKPLEKDNIYIPPDEEYAPYKEAMINWVKQIRVMPREAVKITSFDGLTLVGYYYEKEKGAPIEIMMHGYRGSGERDMSGGVERAFACGRNALIVEQRASGLSDGSVISFGINERRDCLAWIDFVIEKFGEEQKIILTGISMGAATVLMAAGEELPKNVVSVLADCPYTSPKEIIKKVIGEMKLPASLFYPFVKLGARIYGKFDLEETSPIEAVRKAKIPIIFIHGDADAFVPHAMSLRLYEECASEKFFLTVPGAAHGVAYPCDKELYVGAVIDFEKNTGFLNK